MGGQGSKTCRTKFLGRNHSSEILLEDFDPSVIKKSTTLFFVNVLGSPKVRPAKKTTTTDSMPMELVYLPMKTNKNQPCRKIFHTRIVWARKQTLRTPPLPEKKPTGSRLLIWRGFPQFLGSQGKLFKPMTDPWD